MKDEDDHWEGCSLLAVDQTATKKDDEKEAQLDDDKLPKKAIPQLLIDTAVELGMAPSIVTADVAAAVQMVIGN